MRPQWKEGMRVVLVLCMLWTGISWAKRAAPAEVSALHWQGFEFRTIHWGFESGNDQNGGYVEAVELESKKRIWGRRIYVISYKCGMETDSQDVFVTSLKIEEGVGVRLRDWNRVQ